MEFLPVRYAPDAGALWRLVPAAWEDRDVDAFLTRVRETATPEDRAAVRAGLTVDEAGVLLTYARRRLLDPEGYRSTVAEALALIDAGRDGLPRAEFDLVTGLADDPGRVGYRAVTVGGVRRLLLDPDPACPDRIAELAVDLAELTEFQGYRVESITLTDDPMEELLAQVHGPQDAELGLALVHPEGRVRVRSGPRPGGRTGWLTARLIVARSVAGAEAVAAAAERLSTPEAPVIGRTRGFICVILSSDGGDPLEGYEFVLATLFGSPATSGKRRESWRVVEQPPTVLPQQHTMLVLDVDHGDGQRHRWWLAGPPAQGGHPDPAGAWRALAESVDAGADPFAKNLLVTMDYHGPESATVRGFWRGRWVDHRFTRHDGGAAWWIRLAPLLRPEGRGENPG
ncbi:MAG TPA: hypothetical protein VN408_40315 [Actinoplanes sp.]|nr:hypothetical protein [Actinoplanes sp.]